MRVLAASGKTRARAGANAVRPRGASAIYLIRASALHLSGASALYLSGASAGAPDSLAATAGRFHRRSRS